MDLSGNSSQPIKVASSQSIIDCLGFFLRAIDDSSKTARIDSKKVNQHINEILDEVKEEKL
jgi:hypothetical protein